MAKNKTVLDNGELELLAEIERGEWADVPLSIEESEALGLFFAFLGYNLFRK